jgi:hypothetical protein
LIAILLSGCSAFKARKRPNLTPFAEHIISMSQDIQYGFSEEPTIWLNKYADYPDIAPTLGEFRVSANATRRILRGIVAYSIEVVTLAQSRATGSEQADALADYLSSLMGPAFEMEGVDLHITKAEFDSITVDMREQTNLIDALNSAQPVADEVARIVGERIAQTELVLYRLNEAIAAAINLEYAPQLEFRQTIKEQQARALRSLRLLLQAWDGDEAAYRELRETDPILFRGIPEHRKPTDEEAQTLVDRALLRFQRIDAVRQSVGAELESYELEVRELHRLTMEAQQAVRRARATALAWAQAHRKLASGVVDPAQIDMMGITQRVLGGIL